MAKVKGSRKAGRQKKKNMRRGNAESLYVRGLINFDQYQKLTKVKSSK